MLSKKCDASAAPKNKTYRKMQVYANGGDNLQIISKQLETNDMLATLMGKTGIILENGVKINPYLY